MKAEIPVSANLPHDKSDRTAEDRQLECVTWHGRAGGMLVPPCSF